jgi:putative ABC transport system permease protein
MFRTSRAAWVLIGNGDLRRVAYLVLTVAVAVAAWLVLAAMASPFLRVASSDGSDRLQVSNARNRSTPLPLEYAERISRLQGVKESTWLDLQMLSCGNDTVTVSAVGGSGVNSLPDLRKVDAAVMRRWHDDPLGVLVTSATALACGWHIGQGIEPLDVKGQPLAFHIIDILDTNTDALTAIAHYEYVNRTRSVFAGVGRVLRFHVTAHDPGNNQALAESIDAAFSGDNPRVVAYPDTAKEDARSRFGKVQYLLMLVMGAVILSCLLVTVSVMLHATAQRRQQMGLMRALGFSRKVLAFAFVLEVLGIIASGAALGILAGRAVVQHLPQWLEGQFLQIVQAPWAWHLLPVWLAILTVVTLLYPCLAAWRAHPLDSRAP